jgi:hypothetical protein
MKNELAIIEPITEIKPKFRPTVRQKIGLACAGVAVFTTGLFAILPSPSPVAGFNPEPVTSSYSKDVYRLQDSGADFFPAYRAVRIIEDAGSYIVYLDLHSNSLRHAYLSEVRIAGLESNFSN